jgi:hypothetical protein
MDLDKLPHFGSASSAAAPGSAPPPQRVQAELARVSGTQVKRPSKAGEWRLMFPHTDDNPPPSYVEEFNDVKRIVSETLHG